MKKILLTLGGMLVFGIASAQVTVQPGGVQQTTNGSAGSQIRTTTKQDERLTRQQPVGTETSNTFSNQAASAPPAMTTMSTTGTSSNANATNQTNPAQTTSQTTTQSTNVSNTQGNAGQGGMGGTTTSTTTTTGTRRTP